MSFKRVSIGVRLDQPKAKFRMSVRTRAVKQYTKVYTEKGTKLRSGQFILQTITAVTQVIKNNI